MSAFDSLGTIGTGVGAIGSIGGGIYGAIAGSRDAGKVAAAQKQIAYLEMQQDQQRRTAMELTARRQQVQSVRQAQYARSMALTSATSQGAQFGSGLQGGYGSISGQTTENQLGVSQNLEIGENLFNLNNQISHQKMELADAQSKMASDQALGGMFGSIGKSLGPLGSFASALPGLFAL